ncbi:MAG: 50S ribosomal protein L17 [Deltaproteobacteria bacterium]|nr:50S ribosomal protein L17 [Deltaproteobacteria bacterium]
MRHNRDEKRFDRTASHLKSMMANMTNDLLLNGRIKTTTPRAKSLRRYAERMITLGKSGSLAARRRAMAFMRDKTAVTRLFSDIARNYKERHGGYTRILKLGFRPGDAAHMSIIELVESAAKAQAEKPKAAKKASAKKAPAKARSKTAGAAKEPKKPAEKKPRAKKAAKEAESGHE